MCWVFWWGCSCDSLGGGGGWFLLLIVGVVLRCCVVVVVVQGGARGVGAEWVDFAGADEVDVGGVFGAWDAALF